MTEKTRQETKYNPLLFANNWRFIAFSVPVQRVLSWLIQEQHLRCANNTQSHHGKMEIGTNWVSDKRLEEGTGLKRTASASAIEFLEKEGIITREKKKNRMNGSWTWHYIVHLERLLNRPSVFKTIEAPQGDATAYEIEQYNYKNKALDELKKIFSDYIDYEIKSIVGTGANLDPKREVKPQEIDYSFLDPGFKDVFSKWVEYKNAQFEESCFPSSQKAAENFYSLLLNYSKNDPIIANEIVEQSMAFLWEKIFPLDKGPTVSNGLFSPQMKPEAEPRVTTLEETTCEEVETHIINLPNETTDKTTIPTKGPTTPGGDKTYNSTSNDYPLGKATFYTILPELRKLFEGENDAKLRRYSDLINKELPNGKIKANYMTRDQIIEPYRSFIS